MGSRIFLAMDSELDPWPELGPRMVDQFEAWEAALSRFRSTSELSRINRSTGKWNRVSNEFWQVINLALDMEKRTSGLVTPGILDALESAGYTVSFEEMFNDPSRWLKQPLQKEASVREIELDVTSRSIKVPKGLHLDFGGVAKGWAVNEAMHQLAGTAPVLVDAGGDIAVSGPTRNGNAWPIGITDPFNPETNLALVMLTSGGIATSGKDHRRWVANGQWQHHLIDPRIGAPAQTDVFTATVIAEDVIQAEALSKKTLILGSLEAGVNMNARQAYYLVLDDGSVKQSDNFRSYEWNEQWMQIQNNSSV